MSGTASICAPGARFQPQWIVVSVLLLVATYAIAQQTPATSNNAKRSALQQAEQLIQIGELQQAKEIIDRELKLDPANVEAYNLLGIIYTNQKDYSRAETAFQHALQLAPNSPTTH